MERSGPFEEGGGGGDDDGELADKYEKIPHAALLRSRDIAGQDARPPDVSRSGAADAAMRRHPVEQSEPRRAPSCGSSRTFLGRAMYAGMALLPIFDMISDVALPSRTFLLKPSGYWKSALVVWYIIYQSLRFVTSYAPLHPKPSWRAFLLYVPGMLLPRTTPRS